MFGSIFIHHLGVVGLWTVNLMSQSVMTLMMSRIMTRIVGIDDTPPYGPCFSLFSVVFWLSAFIIRTPSFGLLSCDDEAPTLSKISIFQFIKLIFRLLAL